MVILAETKETKRFSDIEIKINMPGLIWTSLLYRRKEVCLRQSEFNFFCNRYTKNGTDTCP